LSLFGVKWCRTVITKVPEAERGEPVVTLNPPPQLSSILWSPVLHQSRVFFVRIFILILSSGRREIQNRIIKEVNALNYIGNGKVLYLIKVKGEKPREKHGKRRKP